MVESRENYKFDLGVKGFIKVVKEQVMKLMAIIKQEMQLLHGWQAGKRCGDICAWAKWSIWPELYPHLVSVTWSNWEYCYFPWPPSPPPPTPPQHFIRFPWQLTGTHSYSWVDGDYVRDNYVPPPRTQHNGLTRCWVYRPLNQESNPPSNRSLYLLVGLLDSTFFPNSNPGLIKMLYYQTRGPLLPEEAGLSKKLK